MKCYCADFEIKTESGSCYKKIENIVIAEDIKEAIKKIEVEAWEMLDTSMYRVASVEILKIELRKDLII